MLSPIQETAVVDGNEQEPNQRSIIINESQPLARCSVLYLGTAIPSADHRGIDSIQEPLSKRYPIDGNDAVRGIEAWLSIDQNGLQIQFASDPSVLIYYPIRSLVYCASVRFATRTESEEKFPNGWRFVPLDTPEASVSEDTQHPPLFTVIFHRTRELPADECHCFVTKTKQSAFALVEACANAYQGTEAEQDCSKAPLYFKILNDGSELKEIDDEFSLVPAVDNEPIADYQTNNQSAGFFYKTDQLSMEYWQLWENPKRRPSSVLSNSSSSSRSSHRQKHHRRLASITSIPESEKSPELPTTTTESVVEPPPPPSMIDPYAPDPNVLRVERIKDAQTGRDIFIRWLRDPAEQPPKTPTPDYDFYVDFDTNDQSEYELPQEIQRLEINDRPMPAEPKRTKRKKEKHRKHHHHHKHSNTTILPLIQPEFQIPPFDFLFPDTQSRSSPFWFYPM